MASFVALVVVLGTNLVSSNKQNWLSYKQALFTPKLHGQRIARIAREISGYSTPL